MTCPRKFHHHKFRLIVHPTGERSHGRAPGADHHLDTRNTQNMTIMNQRKHVLGRPMYNSIAIQTTRTSSQTKAHGSSMSHSCIMDDESRIRPHHLVLPEESKAKIRMHNMDTTGRGKGKDGPSALVGVVALDGTKGGLHKSSMIAMLTIPSRLPLPIVSAVLILRCPRGMLPWRILYI
jgi:hypothetical protein